MAALSAAARWSRSVTRAITALVVLVAASPVPAGAAEMEFVDEWTADDVRMFGYQSVALRAKKPEGLTVVPEAKGTVRYGNLRLGRDPGTKVALLCDSGAKTDDIPGDIYVDANGDGRIDADERATFSPDTPKALESGRVAAGIRVDLPVEVDGRPRQLARDLAVQIDTFGVVAMVAVRGYWRVRPEADGLPEDVYLIDRNADGVVGLAAEDAFMADFNGDGRLDRAQETMPFRAVLPVGPRVFELSINAEGDQLTVTERPQTTGKVTPRIDLSPGAELASLSAVLVGDDGSVTRIDRLGEPIKLRVGAYSVASAMLRIKGREGAFWSYELLKDDLSVGARDVSEDDSDDWHILGAWNLEIKARTTAAKRGDEIPVSLKVASDAGFEIVNCQIDDGMLGQVSASIRFTDPAGRLIGQEASGFG